MGLWSAKKQLLGMLKCTCATQSPLTQVLEPGHSLSIPCRTTELHCPMKLETEKCCKALLGLPLLCGSLWM